MYDDIFEAIRNEAETHSPSSSYLPMSVKRKEGSTGLILSRKNLALLIEYWYQYGRPKGILLYPVPSWSRCPRSRDVYLHVSNKTLFPLSRGKRLTTS